MGQVIEFNQKRIFSLAEARAVFPVVRRVTRTAQEEVRLLWEKLSYLRDAERKAECEAEIQHIFEAWQDKIRKLGGSAKGMWLVDFDCGNGYYCWHYPEPEIDYFHGYEEGFRGRVRLDSLTT